MGLWHEKTGGKITVKRKEERRRFMIVPQYILQKILDSSTKTDHNLYVVRITEIMENIIGYIDYEMISADHADLFLGFLDTRILDLVQDAVVNFKNKFGHKISRLHQQRLYDFFEYASNNRRITISEEKWEYLKLRVKQFLRDNDIKIGKQKEARNAFK